jgi:hypothetical protein
MAISTVFKRLFSVQYYVHMEHRLKTNLCRTQHLQQCMKNNCKLLPPNLPLHILTD